ncbi:MAG TPA: FAD-dependent oxidoreductase [Streptosporangiaceae bacterium]|nr:FAD-dependent oxidoreductase [Streptosporangiaceae bacterium]
MGRRRVAVVGGGVAGLTAAYVLRRTCDVTLFEADDRTGGHAHTHEVGGLRVDSGFIVHNTRTYPLLSRLLAELGVATQDCQMSMSVRCAGCGLQYAGGRGPLGLFGRPRSALRAGYLRMLAEVPRFYGAARRVLADSGDDVTLSRFLADGGYSSYFIDHFTTPLVATVWSCAPAEAGRYPARYLFAFLANHGMLAVRGSPQWRTVKGGSRAYVERVEKELTAVQTATPVLGLRRTETGVEVRDDADTTYRFDAAVIATHADQALRLLSAPTPAERSVLGAFGYSRNETVLHTDASVLPSARSVRASWNYLQPSCTEGGEQVRVSYDMTRLQRLPGPTQYVVTLNGGGSIAPGRVLARMVYEHPIYTPQALAAQRRLPELNVDRIAYAGAYHGWGFHEDGCRSGVAAARALGGTW